MDNWDGRIPQSKARIPPSLLRCPFRVYYYERRRGVIDIKTLNAATGEKGGVRTKRAVLDALLEQARRTIPEISPA